MEVAAAFRLISHAIDSGRAAHGYLICGTLRGQCDVLADMVLTKLFPDQPEQIASGGHPDVIRLEPEGKSRIITVDSMRERMVGPMMETSFSGGWKVGVVVGADRMRQEAANAFLKTLEEPAPKTLFLLLTDQPDAILPTIVSRAQRIDLPLSSGELEGDDYDEIAEAFAARNATALAEKLGALKSDADDEDVSFVRKAFFRTLMSFVRKIMLSGKVPRHQAFRNIEAVEEAYRQSERSLSDEAVLSFLMDRVVF